MVPNKKIIRLLFLFFLFLVFFSSSLKSVLGDNNFSDLSLDNIYFITNYTNNSSLTSFFIEVSNLNYVNASNFSIFLSFDGSPIQLIDDCDVQINSSNVFISQINNISDGTHFFFASLIFLDDNISNNNFSLQFNISNPPNNNSGDGSDNSTVYKDIGLEILLSNPTLNLSHDNLFKVINFDHESGQQDDIDVWVNYSLSLYGQIIQQDLFFVNINSYTSTNTGNTFFPSVGNYSLCGSIINSSYPDNNSLNNVICKDFFIDLNNTFDCNFSVGISSEKVFYDAGEQIKFHNIISNDSFPFIFEYWVEDVFGDILKSKTTTPNLNQKTYTPNFDFPEKILLLKNVLISPSCEQDFSSQKLVVVVGSSNLPDPDSSIDISHQSSFDNLFFGDSFSVSFDVYRGETLKKTVYIFLEDSNGERVSPKYKFSLKNRFSDYSFSFPISIDSDCDSLFSPGEHFLIVEGLGLLVSEEVFISSSFPGCSDKFQTHPQPLDNGNIKGFNFNLNNFSNNFSNSSLFVNISFFNDDQFPVNFSVWSYMYKGPVSFSGIRDSNLKTFHLGPFSNTSTILKNFINASGGDYKFKVKVLLAGQLTPKEIIQEVHFFPKPLFHNFSSSLNSSSFIPNSFDEVKTLLSHSTNSSDISPITGSIIFQSSSYKFKNYFLYLFFGLLVIGIILFLRIR